MRTVRRTRLHLVQLAATTLALAAITLITVLEAAPSHAAPSLVFGPPKLVSKVILDETSVDGPSLWTSGTGSIRTVIAWTGTDVAHHLNVMTSAVNGLTYTNKRILNELSSTRPAVIRMSDAAGGVVAVAWTGTNAGHSLNVLFDVYSQHPQKLTLWSEGSFTSPALAVFHGNLLLGWAGTDANHTLNVVPILLGGSQLKAGQKTILAANFNSDARPSLTLDPNTSGLILSWTYRSPANRLGFATSTDGVHWTIPSASAPLSASSFSGPSIAATATANIPRYLIGWTSTNTIHSVQVQYTESYPSWPRDDSSAVLAEEALGGPATGFIGEYRRYLIAWTGTDPAHHLNAGDIAM
jgi:hypothetical protein